jgi:hypothetical protein
MPPKIQVILYSPVWRDDFGGNRWLTPAERKRARDRPLPGQACRTDHQRIGRRPQNSKRSLRALALGGAAQSEASPDVAERGDEGVDVLVAV